jgi:hypothetical protein
MILVSYQQQSRRAKKIVGSLAVRTWAEWSGFASFPGVVPSALDPVHPLLADDATLRVEVDHDREVIIGTLINSHVGQLAVGAI